MADKLRGQYMQRKNRKKVLGRISVFGAVVSAIGALLFRGPYVRQKRLESKQRDIEIHKIEKENDARREKLRLLEKENDLRREELRLLRKELSAPKKRVMPRRTNDVEKIKAPPVPQKTNELIHPNGLESFLYPEKVVAKNRARLKQNSVNARRLAQMRKRMRSSNRRV